VQISCLCVMPLFMATACDVDPVRLQLHSSLFPPLFWNMHPSGYIRCETLFITNVWVHIRSDIDPLRFLLCNCHGSAGVGSMQKGAVSWHR
jgi:hypothetical protein